MDLFGADEAIDAIDGDAALRGALRRTQRQLKAMLAEAEDSIAVYDPDLQLIYQSPGAVRLWGQFAGHITSHIGDAIVDPEGASETLTRVIRSHEVTQATTFRARFAHGREGYALIRSTNLLGDPEVGLLIINAQDVTERVELEARLRHAATHDPLTGLPNRTFLLSELGAALEPRADAEGTRVAVLFLDLDRFKDLNDSYGHATGDRVLVELAERLRAATGPEVVVARFGGDEFATFSRVADPQVVADMARALTEATGTPFLIEASYGGGREVVEVFLSASIGIATSDEGSGATPESLLHDADAAMYRAKADGPGSWRIYDEQMREEARDRLLLESDFAQAVENGAFHLHYQPYIGLLDGHISGFEALLRWPRPDNTIPPDEFVALAENNGKIHRLGAWALEVACAQLAEWQDRWPDLQLTMSVNLSPRQLERHELPAEIAAVVARTGIDPSSLCLEITERLLIDDMESARRSLDALRDSGVRLALDDFGSGWSSLTYLRSMPVDVVKIDRSFISDLGAAGGNDAIIRAVISMCHAIGAEVVAEGVEHREQVEWLRQLGCDAAQGYLYTPALAATACEAYVERSIGGMAPFAPGPGSDRRIEPDGTTGELARPTD